MAFTTDLTTDIGAVRLLICDLDPEHPIFPDDQMIQVFLDQEDESVKQAAALALETIAGNRAMVMQVIQLLDLKLDGQKTAQGMLDTAKRFRETADDGWVGIDIAQMVDTPFNYRELLVKDLLRGYSY